jgi:electron transfer flavoprotein beta subunit
MRIIVCMKQLCMIYARTGRDPGKGYLAPEDSIYRINPYDEAALETALCIKDAQAGSEIMILTLGPLIAEAELRRCLAMGADDIFHIDTGDDPDPWGKSLLLARAIRALEADLILCGKESLDKRNGQVAAFIGKHLGLPFISAAKDLHIRMENRLEAQRSAGRGVMETVECTLPAVCSVDLASRPPRFPAFEAKKKALGAPIRRLAYPPDAADKKMTSAGTFPPRPRPKRIPAPESRLCAFDRIQQLLAGSRIEKKGAVLRGSPESQVEGIMAFLKEHGIIETKKEL